VSRTTRRVFTAGPEYPTVADSLPGYETLSWTGVGVRAGTPKAICDKIEAGAKTISQAPVLKERLAVLVAETVGSGATEYASFVAAERAKWGKLITNLKLRVGD
jgi:tripartite-type tricarboxylate transporter receptor subunit TctC